MDPRVGPVTVTISGTSAALLARLADSLGSDDAGAVLMRALGLLDMAQRTKRQGGKLVFVNEKGDQAEVAF